MRYLGNKTQHLDFIYNEVVNVLQYLENTNNEVIQIMDAFGGTGVVSQMFNKKGFKTICNDMNDYSYKLCYCRNSITQNDLVFNKLNMNLEQVLNKLNTCDLKGFVYYNYSPNTNLEFERKYFTNTNSCKIDGIRSQIETWYKHDMLSMDEYIFLIALLLESVSLYSNIPGTYGSFNKNWDPRALKPFQLHVQLVPKLLSTHKNKTFNMDARDLIQKYKCDILYMDPPYNERDYSCYYHVLETISQYNNPILKNNKTGTKITCNKSNWCIKSKCVSELEFILKNSDAKCILMSYNNDGFLQNTEIKSIFEKFGTYKVSRKLARRFKCNTKKTEDDALYEYIHILIKP